MMRFRHALLAAATAAGLTASLAACGSATKDWSVASMRQAVQEDVRKFTAKHDGKDVTAVGYYVGSAGYGPALASDPEIEAYNAEFLVVFKAPDSDVESLSVGDEVKIEGKIAASSYDYVSVTIAHVAEVITRAAP
jgi:hypothetical protein